MKNSMRIIKNIGLALTVIAFMASCSLTNNSKRPTSAHPGAVSTTTGYRYNDEGGFQLRGFQGQPTGPNLVFIEGGRTVLGSFEEDILYTRDNVERAVTVSSFYMDETEVANIHWLEFEASIKKTSDEYFWKNNVPDSTVWARGLAYNDPYVNNYYRYPGFWFFPVVGVNWRQAVNYCKWRTQMVNRALKEEAGLAVGDATSEAAEGGGGFGDNLGGDTGNTNANQNITSGSTDQGGDLTSSAGSAIDIASGVVLPGYRLPTEAEWEYAAHALIGTQWLDENQTHRRLYPWDGHSLRNPFGRSQGYFLANFKRGNGDYAGIAGKLNDGAMITTYIYEHPPNDFQLYNMAGNVNEWVHDVYRPLSFYDVEDLNPVRRDSYLDSEEGYDGDYTFIGNERPYTEEEWTRTSGLQRSFNADNPPMKRVRVYKGGSWADVAYWLSPGTRRYLFEDSATATIGFRCAMVRAGSNY